MSRILIVNADDFGMSAAINNGIAQAHEHGIVTSASLMVRRPFAEPAARYASQHPELSLGLHVDLGEWRYENGQWHEVIQGLGDPLEDAEAQLAVFRNLIGHNPTHLDSHQHVHHEEPVLSFLRVLAASLQVPLRGYSEIRHVGTFYGQTATGAPIPAAITLDALVSILRRLEPGVTELSCHPGIDVGAATVYSVERDIETSTLSDPSLPDILCDSDIELRSFSQVPVLGPHQLEVKE